MTGSQEVAPQKLACPLCGISFTIIDDNEGLNYRGYVKSSTGESDQNLIQAMYGICVNEHEKQTAEGAPINPFGIPLILLSDYNYDVGHVVEDEMVEPIPSPALPGLTRKNEFKSMWKQALGDYFFELDPPYVLEDFISSSVNDENRGAEKIPNANRSTEWFGCIWPYMGLSELNYTTATMKENLLISIYLHKTTKLNHIEPLWLYWKRFGMNKRTLLRAINSFPEDLPPHYISTFEEFERDYRPNKTTIHSLLTSLINSKICPQMAPKEMDSFLSYASTFLEKMKNTNYDKDNKCYDFILAMPLISPEISIGHHTLPFAGIIELICVYATLHRKSREASSEFFRMVFPSKADPLWKTVLSKSASKLGIERMVNLLISHILEHTE